MTIAPHDGRAGQLHIKLTLLFQVLLRVQIGTHQGTLNSPLIFLSFAQALMIVKIEDFLGWTQITALRILGLLVQLAFVSFVLLGQVLSNVLRNEVSVSSVTIRHCHKPINLRSGLFCVVFTPFRLLVIKANFGDEK